MTSNLGSEYILDDLSNKDELINKELRRTFKPEFLNRIDEIVFFNSLGKEVVYKILDKIILEINVRLKNRGIEVELTDKVRDAIIDNSYDLAFGARPIKRYVSDKLETLIAMNLIDGSIKDNSKVIFDINDEGGFLIRNN